MSDPDVVALLAQHRTIGAAPREELEWLAAHGYGQHYDPDKQVWRRGEPVDALYVLLSGYLAIWVDRGLGPRKVDEWRGGDVTGLLPYSRMSAAPGDTITYAVRAVKMTSTHGLFEGAARVDGRSIVEAELALAVVPAAGGAP